MLAEARCGAWQRGHGLVRAAGVDLEGPSCPVSSRTELHGSLPAPCTVIGVHGKGPGTSTERLQTVPARDGPPPFPQLPRRPASPWQLDSLPLEPPSSRQQRFSSGF